jgi:hypothetical protein
MKNRVETEMSGFTNQEDSASPTKLPDIQGRNNGGQSELKTTGGGLADI